MNSQSFIRHLYQKSWLYIIEMEEYSKYSEQVGDEIQYFTTDFYADSIPKFIRSLGENYSFYEIYTKIVGSIADLKTRQLIIDFMAWYKQNEKITGEEILYTLHALESNFSFEPMDNLIDYVKTQTYRTWLLTIIPKRILR